MFGGGGSDRGGSDVGSDRGEGGEWDNGGSGGGNGYVGGESHGVVYWVWWH